jgi:hypothetical protein
MISEATVSEPVDAASRGGAFDFGASKLKSRGPTWLSARLGWLGLSGVMASGVLIALSAARTDVLLPESVRPVPGWLAGVFGRGALYGANPYVHGPSAFALDPVYPFIAARWVSTPTAYGPLFTALSYLVASSPCSLGSGASAGLSGLYSMLASWSSLPGCCDVSGSASWIGSPLLGGRRWRSYSPPGCCFPGMWAGSYRLRRSATTAGYWPRRS